VQRNNRNFFDVERHRAAISLRPEHVADFQRLVKTLRFGSKFQFLFADCEDELYRDVLIASVRNVMAAADFPCAQLIVEPESTSNFETFEIQLKAVASEHAIVHVLGANAWFNQQRWIEFNIRREAIASHVKAKLIFWLDTSSLRLAALYSPDIWAWRSAVFDFHHRELESPLTNVPPRYVDVIDNRSIHERSLRASQITALLESNQQLSDEIRLPLVDELAKIHELLGNISEALRIRQEVELPGYERLGYVHDIAVAKGHIADLLQARGDVIEALRIRQEDELPVYERLRDVRSVAVTNSKIAGVLQARGEFTEALRIQQDDVLPIFERLGDVRSVAVTKGKIADLLQASGELTEALRIRQEDELPVYEQLGDLQAFADAKGKIADILLARGDLTQALRIRQNEVLPILERLGDVRGVAVTKGRIADVLAARGDLTEALNMYLDKVLPILSKLGNPNEIAWAEERIAGLRARINGTGTA
jgi:tetratricopeptide (TPR) repeat protein